MLQWSHYIANNTGNVNWCRLSQDIDKCWRLHAPLALIKLCTIIYYSMVQWLGDFRLNVVGSNPSRSKTCGTEKILQDIEIQAQILY